MAKKGKEQEKKVKKLESMLLFAFYCCLLFIECLWLLLFISYILLFIVFIKDFDDGGTRDISKFGHKNRD